MCQPQGRNELRVFEEEMWLELAKVRGEGHSQVAWGVQSGRTRCSFKKQMLSKGHSGCCEGNRLSGGKSGSRRAVRRLRQCPGER